MQYEDDTPELESYMTPKDVEHLDEELKEELRKVKATEPPQRHFDKFVWAAAPGAEFETARNRAEEIRCRAEVYEQLPALADPIPGPEPDEWISGVPHYSAKESASGELWSVLRAMHSRKMHYATKLTRVLKDDPETKLIKCWPDLSPASGGRQPLSSENQRNLVQAFQMKGPMGMIKHIFTWHDGEVRRVGEERWDPFPVSDGQIAKACFWQYQFCKKVGASNQNMLRAIFVFETLKTNFL